MINKIEVAKLEPKGLTATQLNRIINDCRGAFKNKIIQGFFQIYQTEFSDGDNFKISQLIGMKAPQICQLINQIKDKKISSEGLTQSQLEQLSDSCEKSFSPNTFLRLSEVYGKNFSNVAAASVYREKACSNGLGEACFIIGLDLEEKQDNESSALKYFKEGSRLGNIKAAYHCWSITKGWGSSLHDKGLARDCAKTFVDGSHVEGTIEWSKELLDNRIFYSNFIRSDLTEEQTMVCYALKKLKGKLTNSVKAKSKVSDLIEKGC
jgi:hypothetical protein